MNYRFEETEEIKKRLIEIEATKIVFDNAKILPQIEERIRRESLLKSSLYSARIEGNPLTWREMNNLNSEELKKMEINNLLKAYRFVYLSKVPELLTLELIRNLHQMTMKNLSGTAGKFRQEPWAIFNAAEVAVYLAPAFFDVPKLMDEYVTYANALDHHPLIDAGVLQFIFEKIHPFADGNGRVGRLISAYWLKKHNYHFRGLLSFEEYTDNHLEEYYNSLEPNKDMTTLVEYFLTAVAETARSILPKLETNQNRRPLLPPKREEILNIIIDHPYCSFDFLQRRFAAVNPKTLHYDLKRLREAGLIEKVGETRGATYISHMASPKE